jgi:hypothetical protein
VNVAPSTSFEAVAEFNSGLTGTIGVRIRDNQGADTLARTTAGIAADITIGGRSLYRVTLTSPAAAGQYTLIWDDTTTLLTEELVVTRAVAPSLTTAPYYLTPDELKDTRSLIGQSFADNQIDLAIATACRAIDEITERPDGYYPTVDTRVFTADWYSPKLCVGDLVSVTQLDVDADNDGSYETAWTEGTEYTLEPLSASYANRPYREVVLRGYPYPIYRFPFWPRAVRIAGTFGWATTPPQIKAFATILAGKLIVRLREQQAMLGFTTAGADSQAIRIARTDPDFEFYLGPFMETGALIR